MQTINVVFEVQTDDEFSVAKQLDALSNVNKQFNSPGRLILFCKFNEWGDELLTAFGRVRGRCKQMGIKVIVVCSPEVTAAMTPQLVYRLVEYFSQEDITVVFATKAFPKHNATVEDGVYPL